MAQNLKGRSHILVIKRDGAIVAFGLALIGDDEYFGAAEGMDYTVRDSYELYSNMLLETIRVACALKKKTLNLGITTYNFKASLGRSFALASISSRRSRSRNTAPLTPTSFKRASSSPRTITAPSPLAMSPLGRGPGGRRPSAGFDDPLDPCCHFAMFAHYVTGSGLMRSARIQRPEPTVDMGARGHSRDEFLPGSRD
jgi:hypothetical protein